MQTTQETSATNAAKFFELSATYTIEPGATSQDLRDDFNCLFGSGMGALQVDTDDFTHAEWAGIYMLRQAFAVFQELERRLDAERQSQA